MSNLLENRPERITSFGTEYVRADVAKERERLMIEAAYYRGGFDCENGHGGLTDSLDVIYKDAGLEKLK